MGRARHPKLGFDQASAQGSWACRMLSSKVRQPYQPPAFILKSPCWSTVSTVTPLICGPSRSPTNSGVVGIAWRALGRGACHVGNRLEAQEQPGYHRHGTHDRNGASMPRWESLPLVANRTSRCHIVPRGCPLLFPAAKSPSQLLLSLLGCPVLLFSA